MRLVTEVTIPVIKVGINIRYFSVFRIRALRPSIFNLPS